MPFDDDHASEDYAASDVLARLRPDELRAMRLPSRAHRV
jgi:hypothetical protein